MSRREGTESGKAGQTGRYRAPPVSTDSQAIHEHRSIRSRNRLGGSRLSGTVPVAHNIRFDAGFLTAEWHRAGTQFPLEFFEYGLCTMQEASVYLPGNNRNLADCCAAFDITIPHAHSAGDDAEATAQLLAAYMRTETNAEKWTRIFEASQSLQWTVTEPAARTICRLRSRSDAPQETHFLERIVQHIPEAGETAAEIDYLGLLDRALLDRHLSLHEQDALVALANELGWADQEL
ncbi:PolC-type DNA polymerase III [Kocuria carniphila]|uniref:PolC-type DNA polymerase III n=1 Tax=Kocuria carniphila TaxID=262208 RepID=UPI0034CFBA7E